MSKPTFSDKELLTLQLVLLTSNLEAINKRFNFSEEVSHKIIAGLISKVSDLLINPDTSSLHPLAVNREVFDKYHDKIKGAIEYIQGEPYQEDAENHIIWELLGIIGILCGKQLIPNQAQIVGPIHSEFI